MSELYKYPVNFTKEDLNNDGDLVITMPLALIVSAILHAVIKYDDSLDMPTFPTGIKVSSTSPFVVNVNCAECPDGNHVCYLIYLK